MEFIDTKNSEFIGTAVDLRPDIAKMGLKVKSQGSRGTCSVFASTFLLEYMICKERNVSLDSSEEYLNSASNMAINRNEDGDFSSNILKGYKAYGIVDEAWFPYKGTFNPDLKPDNELIAIGKAANFLNGDLMYSQNKPTLPDSSPKGLNDKQILAIEKTLDNKVPVAFGYHGSGKVKTISWGDGRFGMICWMRTIKDIAILSLLLDT